MSSSSDGKLATDLDMNPQYRRRERRRNRARKMSSRSLKVFTRILKTCLLGSEIVRKAHQQLVTVMEPEIVLKTSGCLKETFEAYGRQSHREKVISRHQF